eukprot:CAMPEP_0197387242 /NCGR_PEP_ID=MMETSP1165-20131217/406_1 /TAXON_ID=284809 /ORGANISM="Chrysocystis fragilis, Strain CCMP3189" /LENGTH=417 /DNA_ID=CAMNT_0042912555 /DNA_START=24 /DNA_END=1278 /DNA_ORIENTATION=+
MASFRVVVGALVVALVGAERRVTFYNANPSSTEFVCFVRQGLGSTDAAVLAGPLAFKDSETASVTSSSMAVETYVTTDTCAAGVWRETVLFDLYETKTNVVGYGPGEGGSLKTTFAQVHHDEGEAMTVLFENRASNYATCTFEFGDITQGPYAVGDGEGGEAECVRYRTDMKKITVSCDGDEASLKIHPRDICKASSQHLIAVGDSLRGLVDLLLVQGDPECSRSRSCDSDSERAQGAVAITLILLFVLLCFAAPVAVCCCVRIRRRRRLIAILQERSLQPAARPSASGYVRYVPPTDRPSASTEVEGLELPDEASSLFAEQAPPNLRALSRDIVRRRPRGALPPAPSPLPMRDSHLISHAALLQEPNRDSRTSCALHLPAKLAFPVGVRVRTNFPTPPSVAWTLRRQVSEGDGPWH